MLHSLFQKFKLNSSEIVRWAAKLLSSFVGYVAVEAPSFDSPGQILFEGFDVSCKLVPYTVNSLGFRNFSRKWKASWAGSFHLLWNRTKEIFFRHFTGNGENFRTVDWSRTFDLYFVERDLWFYSSDQFRNGTNVLMENELRIRVNIKISISLNENFCLANFALKSGTITFSWKCLVFHVEPLGVALFIIRVLPVMNSHQHLIRVMNGAVYDT